MNLADHKKITDQNTQQNKVEDLHVSSEMATDSLMDKKIVDGIQKEAREIEDDLRKQTDLPNLDDDPEKKEEMYQNIMWALKRKGKWEEETTDKSISEPRQDPLDSLSPEDRKALEIGRKIQKEQKHPIRRMLLKNVSKAAVVFLCVFVLGMSTEANRKKVLGVWNDIVNGEFRVRINNSDNAIKTDIPEQEAYTEIENQLGIAPIKFMKVPEKLKYINYTVNKQEGNAMIFYQYEDAMLTLYMYSPNAVINRNDSLQGKLSGTVFTRNEMLEMEIREIENISEDNTYETGILYRESYYSVSGKIPLDIFEKLVKEIYF